jgi:hypothetical protein
MNKQTQLLVDKVDRIKDMYQVGPAQQAAIEDFAQLIVKECVGVVEGGSFLHDQAPTAVFARECSRAIKQHFGVE